MEPSNSSQSNNMSDDDSNKQDCVNKPKNANNHGNTAKNRKSGRKAVKVWRLKKDSVVKPCIEEPVVALDDDKAETIPVRTDISAQQKPASSSTISVSQDSSSPPPIAEFPISDNAMSDNRRRHVQPEWSGNPSPKQRLSFSSSLTGLNAVVYRNNRERHFTIPFYWWFGFSRSYEDGRAGEEGRIRHVLSEIEFGGRRPHKWYSDAPLSAWTGITLHPGNVIDCLDIFSEV